MLESSELDSKVLAEGQSSEDILDILVLAQSRVDESYIDRFARMPREHLRNRLDSMVTAGYLSTFRYAGKRFYQNTLAGQRFFENNCSQSISKSPASNSGKPLISIVIPAFNEGKSLGSILRRTRRAMENLQTTFEIIVVDDGSMDDTAEISREYGAVLVKNGANGGKGHALQLGFEKASGSIVITMDADGSHRPEEICRLIYPLLSKNLGANVQAVAGSRFIGEIEKGSIARLHLVGNRFFDLAVRLLTGKRVSDTQSGFRAYKLNVIRTMTVVSLGFEIEAEMIVKMLRKQLALLQVPITSRRRAYGDSRIRPFTDGLRIMRTIIRTTLA